MSDIFERYELLKTENEQLKKYIEDLVKQVGGAKFDDNYAANEKGQLPSDSQPKAHCWYCEKPLGDCRCCPCW